MIIVGPDEGLKVNFFTLTRKERLFPLQPLLFFVYSRIN